MRDIRKRTYIRSKLEAKVYTVELNMTVNIKKYLRIQSNFLWNTVIK
ncbi:MAG: hypothetical protein RI956_769 [Pseudomonadota bacterium]|jgi:hypothetical protein